MAAGIVSVALCQAARPHLSGVLLAIAAMSFAVLLAASAGRPRPSQRPARRPEIPGTGVHVLGAVACGVLGDRLASDGHRYPAAALATAALLARLVLICLLLARLAARSRMPPVTDAEAAGICGP